MSEHPVKRRKKLIEVAIPLEAISAASSREKRGRHGHPSTMHLWWSRKPLATARAILFCQLVDDPSSVPEEFDSDEKVENERIRLFAICSALCEWENTRDKFILSQAKAEIKRTWDRAKADHGWAQRKEPASMPPFYDPFAGGGSIPSEALRLGLRSFASDINPVSVLINKASIEIPSIFSGTTPLSADMCKNSLMSWQSDEANGLSADITYYGKIVNERAHKKLKDIYPSKLITEEITAKRPDLKKYEGKELEVIAWLWVRTVKSPNPFFSAVPVPLTTSFFLSNKKGKEAWIEPIIEQGSYELELKVGTPLNPKAIAAGTRISQGKFKCLMSGEVFDYKYVDQQAEQGGLGSRMVAIVLQGTRERVYVEPTPADAETASIEYTGWKPDVACKGTWASNAQGRRYGFNTFGDYFSNRQLTAINAIADGVRNIEKDVERDCINVSKFDIPGSLEARQAGHRAYAQAISIYLSFALSKVININSTIASWMTDRGAFRETFARQGIAMSWDYAEANPFASTGGSYMTAIDKISKAVDSLPFGISSNAFLHDAKRRADQELPGKAIISTDPPYYDNIGYADLSDYFYVWLRKSTSHVYPHLFSTISTPKDAEIFASAYKHGSKENAEKAFLLEMKMALNEITQISHPSYPITLYYAFKQVEKTDESGRSSTGWETFLASIIESGLAVVGTWPIRTESSGRIVANGANALATSMLLVCRQRDSSALVISRSEFRRELRAVIRQSVRELESSNLAPVDIAQAVIGPGMAIYSQAKSVLNTDDSQVSVRDALKEINAALDELLSQDEGELDADSRFALTFFESYGYSERDFGDAEDLAKARNLSVAGVAAAGILRSVAGKVKLLQRSEIEEDWDPTRDKRLCIWEATQQLIRRLEAEGEDSAALLLSQLKQTSGHGDLAANCKALAYRLYSHCEKTKQVEEARAYNGLVIAWPELERLASSQPTETTVQASLI